MVSLMIFIFNKFIQIPEKTLKMANKLNDLTDGREPKAFSEIYFSSCSNLKMHHPPWTLFMSCVQVYL